MINSKYPILCDYPMPIVTDRLILRPLQAGDGKIVFNAIEESKENLSKWLPWPKYVTSWGDSERFARESYANFLLRKSCNLGVFKGNDFIGVCGFNYFLWNIPSAEIGYWCRLTAQNNGYMREATTAITHYGFTVMGLKRIVITCLDENKASIAVAERSGYQLEAKALGLMKSEQQNDLALCRRYVMINNT